MQALSLQRILGDFVSEVSRNVNAAMDYNTVYDSGSAQEKERNVSTKCMDYRGFLGLQYWWLLFRKGH